MNRRDLLRLALVSVSASYLTRLPLLPREVQVEPARLQLGLLRSVWREIRGPTYSRVSVETSPAEGGVVHLRAEFHNRGGVPWRNIRGFGLYRGDERLVRVEPVGQFSECWPGCLLRAALSVDSRLMELLS